MSQGLNEGYFTTLLNSYPQQYSSSPNQSNLSTPSSQNSNSSLQPRKGKKVSKKQPIVDLDEDDDDDVEEKRANTNAAEPIDEDNIAELFGPDLRARPAGKPRPSKKAKSMDTSSARRKCEDAEAVYEAKRKKELGLLECRELEFLMIYPSSLPPEKSVYI
ncbi:hypothetical protein Tco_0273083 [Tanacetum coccineum]